MRNSDSDPDTKPQLQQDDPARLFISYRLGWSPGTIQSAPELESAKSPHDTLDPETFFGLIQLLEQKGLATMKKN